MTNKSITLVLPGFLPTLLHSYQYEPLAITKMLSRSKQMRSLASFENIIKNHFEGFGQEPLPEGILGAFHQGLVSLPQSKNWCRVQFIECHADHQTVYVTGKEDHLSIDEQNALLTTFQPFFKQDDHELFVTSNGEWYLALSPDISLKTQDVLSMIGKSLASFLPNGPDKAYWHRLITECQMLLMSHPVNQKRQMENKKILSSLWFEGSGKLTGKIGSHVTHLCSDESSLLGLAQFSGIRSSSINEGYNGVEGKPHVFIVDRSFLAMTREQKSDEIVQTLHWWEDKWFGPLCHALDKGKVEKLLIYDLGERCFVLTPWSQKFFWRRIKPLTAFMTEYR